MLQFYPDNVLIFFKLLARFLSLASFELVNFLGAHTSERILFFSQKRWLIPFGIFLGAIGFIQPIILLLQWFSRHHSQEDWKPIKFFTLGTFLLLYFSFLFSFKEPGMHTFYIVLPVVMIYSLYCWNEWLKKPRWSMFAVVFLISGLILQAGIAVHRYSSDSMYKNKKILVSAIKTKNYHLFGERRRGSRY
jgi:hypothetical protein